MEIYLHSIGIFTGVVVLLTVFLLLAEKFLADYGVCAVSINSGEREFSIDGGDTLLGALYANEIFIPSACGGKGSCGYCKVTVHSGGGPLLPTEKPYLTRREIRSNARLACQVKVKEDLKMGIPQELLNVKLYKSHVLSTRDLTYDTKELRLALEEPKEIAFNAGQYGQILAPGPDGDVFRAYSISSPTYVTEQVEFNVRLVPGGIASTYVHDLKEGDPVTFTGPFGEWRMSEDPECEMVCVGGGVGMAPMKSIIFSLYKQWPDRVCWFFFGCRGTDDIFYLEDFQKLAAEHPNFHVCYALSDIKPGQKWDGDKGFIHLSVDKHLQPTPKRQAFLCGPPLMIEAVTTILKEKGLNDSDIFYDKFD